MKIIHGGLRQGKTYRAVQWAKKSKKRGILVHSIREKERLLATYEGLEPGQILVLGEDRLRRAGRERMNICIDNLDMLLGWVCSPHKPVMCTTAEWTSVEQIGAPTPEYDEFVKQLKDHPDKELFHISKEDFDKYYTGRWEVNDADCTETETDADS